MGNPNIPQKVIVTNLPAGAAGLDGGGAGAEGGPGKKGARGRAGRIGAGVKGPAVLALLDAGLKAKDTYDNAVSQDEKAEGYGQAAGGLAGTLAGAAAGAAIGSMVPIIGTVVGGLIGAALGNYGGDALGGMAGKSLFGTDESRKRVPDAGPLMMADAGKNLPPVMGNIAQSFAPPVTAPLMLANPGQVAAPAPLAPLKPSGPAPVSVLKPAPVAPVNVLTPAMPAPSGPAPVNVLKPVMPTAALAWQAQDWRYSQQLAEQSKLHTDTLNQLMLVSAAQQQIEQEKRQALEQRLSASEQTHYRVLSDAQRDQGRLRDSLATADVRLSVLLDATESATVCPVSATPSTGGVVHGPTRAQLDPAHAQRIIGITDAGDQGLIALAACQAYAKEVSTPK